MLSSAGTYDIENSAHGFCVGDSIVSVSSAESVLAHLGCGA